MAGAESAVHHSLDTSSLSIFTDHAVGGEVHKAGTKDAQSVDVPNKRRYGGVFVHHA